MSMREAALEALAKAEIYPELLAGRPHYHGIPPAGWMNDPNGLCHFQGLYHLFYQHNPCRPRWDRMCWGHLVSQDLLAWCPVEPALVPEHGYESFLGCFSGGALVEGDRLHLMYTGVALGGQAQCLASSTDGIHFEKSPRNPVITRKALPRGYGRHSFRDPRPFVRDGRYYCLVGAARRPGPIGEVLLFRSDDLVSWDFVGPVLGLPESPMLECPELVELSGQDVLILSPKTLPARGLEFRNLHSSVYLVGRLNLATGRFEGGGYREIDGGTDFYAPQCLKTPDGRTVLMAWMGMWRRSLPTKRAGWAGAMTLPRELSLQGEDLVQRPLRETEGLRKNGVSHRGIVLDGTWCPPGHGGSCAEILLDLDLREARTFELAVLKEGSSEARIRWEAASGCLGIDLSQTNRPALDLATHWPVSGRWAPVELEEGRLRLRVFLDESTLEVFAQNGRLALSCRVYGRGPGQEGIELRSLGRVLVENYELHDLIRIERFETGWAKSPRP